MNYHHYTDEEVKAIEDMSVLSFLQEQGYEFKRIGNSFRCKEHPSLSINTDEKQWYWHSCDKGGYGVIDWCKKIENLSFPEALNRLSEKSISYIPKAPEQSVVEKKEFKLPKAFNGKFSRAFAYLVYTRKIDKSVINDCFKNGSLYEDEKHNVIAVGFDENGNAKYATKRGTNTEVKFRGEVSGSDKHYGFSLPADSERVYVFEGFGDVLAHATLVNMKARMLAKTPQQKQNADYAYKGQSRIALGGVSDNALEFYLKNNPQTKQICFCLDNDEGGKTATQKHMKKYSELGYEVFDKTLTKVNDYGDLLTEYIKASSSESTLKKTNKSVRKIS